RRHIAGTMQQMVLSFGVASGSLVTRFFIPDRHASNAEGYNPATSTGGADMPKTKQFTVIVGNQPGALAQIAKTLGNSKVNILALLGTAQGTNATVELVVEDPRRAKKALDGAGLTYQETTAEEYELQNKPGALAQ